MIICIVKGTLFQENDQFKKKNYIFCVIPVNISLRICLKKSVKTIVHKARESV